MQNIRSFFELNDFTRKYIGYKKTNDTSGIKDMIADFCERDNQIVDIINSIKCFITVFDKELPAREAELEDIDKLLSKKSFKRHIEALQKRPERNMSERDKKKIILYDKLCSQQEYLRRVKIGNLTPGGINNVSRISYQEFDEGIALQEVDDHFLLERIKEWNTKFSAFDNFKQKKYLKYAVFVSLMDITGYGRDKAAYLMGLKNWRRMILPDYETKVVEAMEKISIMRQKYKEEHQEIKNMLIENKEDVKKYNMRSSKKIPIANIQETRKKVSFREIKALAKSKYVDGFSRLSKFDSDVLTFLVEEYFSKEDKDNITLEKSRRYLDNRIFVYIYNKFCIGPISNLEESYKVIQDTFQHVDDIYGDDQSYSSGKRAIDDLVQMFSESDELKQYQNFNELFKIISKKHLKNLRFAVSMRSLKRIITDFLRSRLFFKIFKLKQENQQIFRDLRKSLEYEINRIFMKFEQKELKMDIQEETQTMRNTWNTFKSSKIKNFNNKYYKIGNRKTLSSFTAKTETFSSDDMFSDQDQKYQEDLSTTKLVLEDPNVLLNDINSDFVMEGGGPSGTKQSPVYNKLVDNTVMDEQKQSVHTKPVDNMDEQSIYTQLVDNMIMDGLNDQMPENKTTMNDKIVDDAIVSEAPKKKKKKKKKKTPKRQSFLGGPGLQGQWPTITKQQHAVAESRMDRLRRLQREREEAVYRTQFDKDVGRKFGITRGRTKQEELANYIDYSKWKKMDADREEIKRTEHGMKWKWGEEKKPFYWNSQYPNYEAWKWRHPTKRAVLTNINEEKKKPTVNQTIKPTVKPVQTPVEIKQKFDNMGIDEQVGQDIPYYDQWSYDGRTTPPMSSDEDYDEEIPFDDIVKINEKDRLRVWTESQTFPEIKPQKQPQQTYKPQQQTYQPQTVAQAPNDSDSSSDDEEEEKFVELKETMGADIPDVEPMGEDIPDVEPIPIDDVLDNKNDDIPVVKEQEINQPLNEDMEDLFAGGYEDIKRLNKNDNFKTNIEDEDYSSLDILVRQSDGGFGFVDSNEDILEYVHPGGVSDIKLNMPTDEIPSNFILIDNTPKIKLTEDKSEIENIADMHTEESVNALNDKLQDDKKQELIIEDLDESKEIELSLLPEEKEIRRMHTDRQQKTATVSAFSAEFDKLLSGKDIDFSGLKDYVFKTEAYPWVDRQSAGDALEEKKEEEDLEEYKINEPTPENSPSEPSTRPQIIRKRTTAAYLEEIPWVILQKEKQRRQRNITIRRNIEEGVLDNIPAQLTHEEAIVLDAPYDDMAKQVNKHVHDVYWALKEDDDTLEHEEVTKHMVNRIFEEFTRKPKVTTVLTSIKTNMGSFFHMFSKLHPKERDLNDMTTKVCNRYNYVNAVRLIRICNTITENADFSVFGRLDDLVEQINIFYDNVIRESNKRHKSWESLLYTNEVYMVKKTRFKSKKPLNEQTSRNKKKIVEYYVPYQRPNRSSMNVFNLILLYSYCENKNSFKQLFKKLITNEFINISNESPYFWGNSDRQRKDIWTNLREANDKVVSEIPLKNDLNQTDTERHFIRLASQINKKKITKLHREYFVIMPFFKKMYPRKDKDVIAWRNNPLFRDLDNTKTIIRTITTLNIQTLLNTVYEFYEVFDSEIDRNKFFDAFVSYLGFLSTMKVRSSVEQLIFEKEEKARKKQHNKMLEQQKRFERRDKELQAYKRKSRQDTPSDAASRTVSDVQSLNMLSWSGDGGELQPGMQLLSVEEQLQNDIDNHVISMESVMRSFEQELEHAMVKLNEEKEFFEIYYPDDNKTF